jgi:hypothetical protein
MSCVSERPRFDSVSGHVGFVVDRDALGQVFFKYFSLPPSILILPTVPHLSSSTDKKEEMDNTL